MRKGNWHMGSRRKEAELYQTGEKMFGKSKVFAEKRTTVGGTLPKRRKNGLHFTR